MRSRVMGKKKKKKIEAIPGWEMDGLKNENMEWMTLCSLSPSALPEAQQQLDEETL